MAIVRANRTDPATLNIYCRLNHFVESSIIMSPEEISSSQEAVVEPINQPEPAFGWTAYAEQINGRFAMIGFVSLLILELFTHQDFFTWLGMR